MKKKWTVIDTLIVIAVIIVGVVLFKVFGGSVDTGDKTTIQAVVLLAGEEPQVADAIAEGDKITVSLTEKDAGVLKKKEVKDAEKMVFNSIDGEYRTTNIEGKVDIYATVELEVTESDLAYSTGSTFVKVGEKMPFRGKGYALEGYVIEINEVANNE